MKRQRGQDQKRQAAISCDTCAYYAYDEEYEEYFCENDMDEDDYSHLLTSGFRSCPYYRNGDEYAVVRHQM